MPHFFRLTTHKSSKSHNNGLLLWKTNSMQNKQWFPIKWQVMQKVCPCYDVIMIYVRLSVNPLRYPVTHVCVQKMACRLIVAKSLSEPMLWYCSWDPKEYIYVQFHLKFASIHAKKCTFEYVVCEMAAILSRPQCLNTRIIQNRFKVYSKQFICDITVLITIESGSIIMCCVHGLSIERNIVFR